MSFLTGLALRRPAVTVMVIILVMIGGVVSYQGLQRERFPEIEFPNIIIITSYPSGNPDAVVRDLTEPIEEAILGMEGLKELRSVSTGNSSTVTATFEFGDDMEELERTIESNLNGITFPSGVDDPYVTRIASDVFPVMQLSVLGDRDIPSLQRIVDDLITPHIKRVDGVFNAQVLGWSEEQVHVSVDPARLEELGLSTDQVAAAIRDNISHPIPAGNIDSAAGVFAVHTVHEVGTLQELKDLVVGFEGNPGPLPGGEGRPLQRPVLLSHVAEVEFGTAKAATISRTNGKPSLSISVVKDPDANTVDVTSQVLDAVTDIPGLPDDVEVVVITNDGPVVEESLRSLLSEGMWGLIFAVSMVFLFLLNLRPTLLKGVSITLRPTLIIGLSIPLSILTAVIIMALVGVNLNFMSLAGLAIAVGRVVDDSIVVLESIYRHIQAGEEHRVAAVEATREVGAAIVSSTLTTVVVFIPLGFIQGLVGSFFTPFAMTVSFALLASTLVALTAVPALGMLILRRGDFPDEDNAATGNRDPLIVRIYLPLLRWALRRKLATLLIAALVTGGSLGLLTVIPITFFPVDAPEFLVIDIELPTKSSAGETFEVVREVETVLGGFQDRGIVDAYQATLFAGSDDLGEQTRTGGKNIAGIIVTLEEDAPSNVVDLVRDEIPDLPDYLDGAEISVSAVLPGPPADALEVTVTGSNYSDIAAYAKRLEAEISGMEGIVNLTSDISEARNEVVIRIDPARAAEYGVTASSAGRQVNRYVVGQTVSEVDLLRTPPHTGGPAGMAAADPFLSEGVTMDVVVRGAPDDVDDIEKLKSLRIEGMTGAVKLGAISDIAVERSPVSISRFDGERSVSITADITSEDTQAVGADLQRRIDSLEPPPGVEVRTGGIFSQIAEGFEDIFTAMAIGIVLVYLVMVASLGSLRSPFVIVMSLPLALVGALVALAITGRTLSLSALMGILLLIGVVVTNAIVLIVFVEQLREHGSSVYEALIEGSRVRLRPILMTAFTTTFALLPLATFAGETGGVIGSELATVVIGGLISSTFLTLIVVPVVYTIVHQSIPDLLDSIRRMLPPGRGRGQAQGRSSETAAATGSGE